MKVLDTLAEGLKVEESVLEAVRVGLMDPVGVYVDDGVTELVSDALTLEVGVNVLEAVRVDVPDSEADREEDIETDGVTVEECVTVPEAVGDPLRDAVLLRDFVGVGFDRV